MKIVINILLTAAVCGLIYLLYQSIAEPIQFEEEWAKRERKVANQLEDVRTAQLAFKDIVGYYAPNFDTLVEVLKTENFKIKNVIGDPDDPNSNYREFTTEVNALDSMNTLGIRLDSLQFIPYTDGKEFDLVAKVLPEYQNAKNIPVLKVSALVGDYMGAWAHPRYNRYNKNYNPNSILFFGDLGKPTTDGNWRK